MAGLFKHFPSLEKQLPCIKLCNLPTPVSRLENFGRAAGHDGLYLKQDGVTGSLYGGNKIRKLEFLLADAVRQGKKAVLTFGGAGSNHALATAVYAGSLGIKPVLMLMNQPGGEHVRRNLLLDLASNAELHFVKAFTDLDGDTAQCLPPKCCNS